MAPPSIHESGRPSRWLIDDRAAGPGRGLAVARRSHGCEMAGAPLGCPGKPGRWITKANRPSAPPRAPVAWGGRMASLQGQQAGDPAPAGARKAKPPMRAQPDLYKNPLGYEPDRSRCCQAETRIVEPPRVLSDLFRLVPGAVANLVSEQATRDRARQPRAVRQRNRAFVRGSSGVGIRRRRWRFGLGDV